MKSLLYFLLVIITIKTNAQVASTYTSIQYNGTYTSITGDGGTVLGDQNSDDETFMNDVTGSPSTQTGAGFPIGFTFNYDGTAYTQFAVNTNGYIMLGNLPSFTMPINGCGCFGNGYSGVNNWNGISLFSISEVISALNYDLQGQPGSSIQFLTHGAAPNRILTVQWEGFQSYGQAGDNYNFQINLWESQDIVQIVYGAFAHNTTPEDARVGLYGASNADFYFLSDAGGGWGATTVNGAGGASSVGMSDVEIPTSGLTFQFGLIASLPIELISFNAEPVKKGVELSWLTATETNNSFFTLERSTDAQNFSEVVRVSSKADKGNSLTRLNYSYTDEKPLKGTSYYRLKQTDYNGRYKYFTIASVNFIEEKNITFSVKPNPNQGEFVVDFSGAENNHEVQILLHDELGRLVYSNSFYTQQSSNTVNIVPDEKLNKGNYFCSLIVEGIKYSVKVVVN